MRAHQYLICVLLMLWHSFCYGMENVFYIMHDHAKQALTSLSPHIKPSTIIIAQSYHIDKSGIVTGTLDPEIINFAKNKPVKLMAMITNSGFNSNVAHQFLTNTAAQNVSIVSIITECKKNHLYGVQFDFEMIKLEDRNALTTFYTAAATALHKNGFAVSFAVAPIVANDHFPSFYQKRLYEVWQGAYDLQSLAKISNFITVMAYDQHGQGTTPGPIASILWDEQVIKCLLKWIPASKLSLGVPTYSGFWYMSTNAKTNKIAMRYSSLNRDQLKYITDRYHTEIMWDETDKVNYTFYEYFWLNKFIFVENAESFRFKQKLAKKYNLRGISVFRLGIEDPAIWRLL